MDPVLLEKLKQTVRGEVLTDDATLTEYSYDTSLFEVRPQVVVCPKDTEDLQELIEFVRANKKAHPDLSLTARSGGTDMSGGAINDSIIVSFTQHFNDKPKFNVKNKTATFQPGLFYRDFETESLKHDLLFPSYPGSKMLCAMGGIVNNNAGGEKSFQYGKTEKFITKVKMVLSDGNEYTFQKLTEEQLKAKKKQKDFEGQIYRDVHKLIEDNYDDIMAAKPKVSKNSAGYSLWNIWDKEAKTFDLTQLFIGAQGTLGIMTEAETKLVEVSKHQQMMVIFMYETKNLGRIIEEVLAVKPESFESYDDNTLKLALKFFPEFAAMLGAKNFIDTGFKFLPEFMMLAWRRKLPKLILQIEFTGNDPDEISRKMEDLQQRLEPLNEMTRIAVDDEALKYWLIRRDSFSLLRKKVKDMHTAPFIDDFSIQPDKLGEFIPKVQKIFKKYPQFIYTIAGHVGDGNFHIIPLAKIENPKVRKAIPVIADKIFKMVVNDYNGTIDSEHNDGLIRTPYLEMQYGKKITKLFAQTKDIFDPKDMFNPRKKVNGDLDYAMQRIRKEW